jgi:hypothetical protein
MQQTQTSTIVSSVFAILRNLIVNKKITTNLRGASAPLFFIATLHITHFSLIYTIIERGMSYVPQNIHANQRMFNRDI